MSMAATSPSVLDQEYVSRSALHYGLRISYFRIAKAIREGKIAMHLIDGVIKFKTIEVIQGLSKPSKAHLYAR
jgi:hypothetical protein